MKNKRVYFVRHGETEGNIGKYFQFPDTKLTEKGLKGADAVAARCKSLDAEALIASYMTRAQQTAEAIAKKTGLELETFNEFHEHLAPTYIRGKEHGSEEGQKYLEELKEKYLDNSWSVDGAENYFALRKRMENCVEMLENREEEKIIVVSHGFFLGSLFAYLVLQKNGTSKDNVLISSGVQHMSNVGITVFDYVDGQWRLFTYNDHAHFAE